MGPRVKGAGYYQETGPMSRSFAKPNRRLGCSLLPVGTLLQAHPAYSVMDPILPSGSDLDPPKTHRPAIHGHLQRRKAGNLRIKGLWVAPWRSDPLGTRPITSRQNINLISLNISRGYISRHQDVFPCLCLRGDPQFFFCGLSRSLVFHADLSLPGSPGR